MSQTPHHHRLIVLGSGPRRLHRRRLRGPRQPEARGHHRPGSGRPADDHHRGGQLASGCRRRHGSGPDGPLREARPPLRHRNHLRPHPHRQAGSKTLHPGRRCRHLHLRRPDHCHRRLRPVPGPALRGSLHGPRRLRLRHLRRFLLPQQAGGRGRRRQHRRRGSPLPGQHRQPRHRDPPSRQVQGREDHAGKAVREGKGRQGHDPVEQHPG